jgi:hypothetical protein
MGVAAQIPMSKFTAGRAKAVAAVMWRLAEEGVGGRGVATRARCAEVAATCAAGTYDDGLREAAAHVLAMLE